MARVLVLVATEQDATKVRLQEKLLVIVLVPGIAGEGKNVHRTPRTRRARRAESMACTSRGTEAVYMESSAAVTAASSVWMQTTLLNNAGHAPPWREAWKWRDLRPLVS